MNLKQHRERVEREIEAYVYEVHEGAIGRAWPDAKVQAGIITLKAALVEPHVVDVLIKDSIEQIEGKSTLVQSCVVVADNGAGMLLVFSPLDGEYMLAAKREKAIESIGVRGDAVGCFLAI